MKFHRSFLMLVAIYFFAPLPTSAQTPKSVKTNPIYSRFQNSFQKDFVYLEENQQKIQKRLEKISPQTPKANNLSSKLEQYSNLKNSYLKSYTNFSEKPSLSNLLVVKQDLAKIRQLEIQLLKLLAQP